MLTFKQHFRICVEPLLHGLFEEFVIQFFRLV